MATLKFTRQALADLDDIRDYTLREWGEQQARTYVQGIDTKCHAIASGEVRTRPFPAAPKISGYCRYEHHYIFFVNTATATIIIAILHERMSMIERVKDRL